MQRRFIIGCLLAVWTMSQAAMVNGRVEDMNGAAMPFVTISVLRADSSLLTGTITDDHGKWNVDIGDRSLVIGDLMVKASYIGYETQCVNLSAETDTLIIRLHEESEQLAEVVVLQKAPLVERRMDKIVMNVASSPFAVGNNGKDILKKAPGVHIDRKGKITVNGKPIEVYIDGRPSYLSGKQLKAMLEGTDGATIDRLEIITQPSSKYDAAGQGGIINIKTKRNRTKGLNGSVSAGYGGMYWRDIKQYMQDEHVSFNLNYRGAKTYTVLSLTQQFGDRTETYQASTCTPEDTRATQSRVRNQRQYYLFKMSNDFLIDSVNTLGFIVSVPVSFNYGNGDSLYNFSTLHKGATLMEHNTEEQRLNNRWMQHTANINYTHVFSSSLDRELTVNIDYNRNNSHAKTDSRSHFMPVLLPAYSQQIAQNTRHLTNIYSARLDFQTNFWQTGAIECGAKWLTTQTGFHSRLDTLSAGAMTSDFNYTEHIAALYTTVSKQFGEHWSAKLGLRGEYTLTNGKWLSADSTTRKSYFNLFPMAFVSYMPTPKWSISLDYTRRIERPHYTMLDPSVQYEDGHSIRIGNTDLKPSFIHELMLSFGYSEYVTLDFAFGHQRDLMDYQTTVLPEGKRVAQAVNYGTSVFHGIFLSLTEIPIIPKFSTRDEQGKRQINGSWLALTAQIGAGHEITKSYDGQMNLRQWMVDISAELNAYLPKDWTISVDGMYTTPSVWGMERMSAWVEMNLALKKDFPQLGLTLTARVNDLLLSSKWHSETLGLPAGYTNTFSGYDRAHCVSFGLSYKFGTTFEHRQHADLDDTRLSESTKRHKKSR